MPDISIITPTLNAGAYVERCARSIGQQQNIRAQHLVIDGGSSDNTLERASQCGAEVHSLPGSSMYEALNFGVSISKAKYIGFLNADDFYHSDSILMRVAHELATLEIPGLVYGNCRFVNAKQEELYRLRPPKNPSILGSRLRLFNIPHPSWFIHKSAFYDVGEYDTSLKYVSDCDFILRALIKNCGFRYLNDDLSTFTLHGANASRSEKALAEWKVVFVKYNGKAWSKRLLNYVLLMLLYSKDPRYFLYRIRRLVASNR